MRERKQYVVRWHRQRRVCSSERMRAANLRRTPRCSVPSIGFLMDDGLGEGLEDKRR